MNLPRLPAPPVQLLGSAVLLQGRAISDAYYLISLGIRETTRRDAIQPSPALRELLAVLATARAMSAPGHTDVREQPDLTASKPLDELTTAEAARMLDITERQARRIVPTLGARRTTRGWLTHRAALETHAHERQEKP